MSFKKKLLELGVVLVVDAIWVFGFYHVLADEIYYRQDTLLTFNRFEVLKVIMTLALAYLAIMTALSLREVTRCFKKG